MQSTFVPVMVLVMLGSVPASAYVHTDHDRKIELVPVEDAHTAQKSGETPQKGRKPGPEATPRSEPLSPSDPDSLRSPKLQPDSPPVISPPVVDPEMAVDPPAIDREMNVNPKNLPDNPGSGTPIFPREPEP